MHTDTCKLRFHRPGFSRYPEWTAQCDDVQRASSCDHSSVRSLPDCMSPAPLSKHVHLRFPEREPSANWAMKLISNSIFAQAIVSQVCLGSRETYILLLSWGNLKKPSISSYDVFILQSNLQVTLTHMEQHSAVSFYVKISMKEMSEGEHRVPDHCRVLHHSLTHCICMCMGNTIGKCR